MYEQHVQARFAFKKSIVMQKERRRRRRKGRSIEIHQVKVASSTSTLYTASSQWWMTYTHTIWRKYKPEKKKAYYILYIKKYTLTAKSVAPIPSCQVFFTHRIIFKQQQWSKGATNQLWHLSGFIILITVRLASAYTWEGVIPKLAANVQLIISNSIASSSSC